MQKETTEVCGQLKNILNPNVRDSLFVAQPFDAKIPWCIPGSFYLYAGAWKVDRSQGTAACPATGSSCFPFHTICLPSSGELQHKNHCLFSIKWTIPKWILAVLEFPQFSSCVPVLSPGFITPTNHLSPVKRSIGRRDLPRPQLSWVEFTKQGPPPTTVSSSRLRHERHVRFPLYPNWGEKTRRVEKWGWYDIYNRGGLIGPYC